MQRRSQITRSARARDAGLARLRRSTRRLVLGATALAGAFAGLAAHSRPGHKSRPRSVAGAARGAEPRPGTARRAPPPPLRPGAGSGRAACRHPPTGARAGRDQPAQS